MKHIEEFYRKNFDIKVRLITRLMLGDKSSAEDIVQEAFCRAIKFEDTFDERVASFETWFNSILFNCFREHKNMMFNKPINNTQELCPEHLIQEINADNSEERRRIIEHKIRKVPNSIHRRVLTLFFIYGYNSREIGQLGEVTQTNVTTIVTRFREKFV
jgi:RNA polymerase sigma factor (sigma-70 family)